MNTLFGGVAEHRLAGDTADGCEQHLNAIDAIDAGTIHGWSVGNDGEPAPTGAWSGLPATVAGLACR